MEAHPYFQGHPPGTGNLTCSIKRLVHLKVCGPYRHMLMEKPSLSLPAKSLGFAGHNY